MVNRDASEPVLDMAQSLDLYYDLLEHTKSLEEQLRMMRDRILSVLASRRLERVEADGYEAIRQLRHHPPRLNEERAEELLRDMGRLEECQVEVLDEERARQVIDELFQHGSISKDDLPYVYVKPTEALIVRPVEEVEEIARPARRARRAA